MQDKQVREATMHSTLDCRLPFLFIFSWNICISPIVQCPQIEDHHTQRIKIKNVF